MNKSIFATGNDSFIELSEARFYEKPFTLNEEFPEEWKYMFDLGTENDNIFLFFNKGVNLDGIGFFNPSNSDALISVYGGESGKELLFSYTQKANTTDYENKLSNILKEKYNKPNMRLSDFKGKSHNHRIYDNIELFVVVAHNIDDSVSSVDLISTTGALAFKGHNFDIKNIYQMEQLILKSSTISNIYIYNMRNLKNIKLPSTIESLRINGVSASTQIKELDLRNIDNLKSVIISTENNLEELYIGSGITSLTITDCQNLRKLVVNNTETLICPDSFSISGCPLLEDIEVGNIENFSIKENSNNLSRVKFNGPETTLVEGALYSKNSMPPVIYELNFPEKIESIPDCIASLPDEIEIPESVKSISNQTKCVSRFGSWIKFKPAVPPETSLDSTFITKSLIPYDSYSDYKTTTNFSIKDSINNTVLRAYKIVPLNAELPNKGTDNSLILWIDDKRFMKYGSNCFKDYPESKITRGTGKEIYAFSFDYIPITKKGTDFSIIKVSDNSDVSDLTALPVFSNFKLVYDVPSDKDIETAKVNKKWKLSNSVFTTDDFIDLEFKLKSDNSIYQYSDILNNFTCDYEEYTENDSNYYKITNISIIDSPEELIFPSLYNGKLIKKIESSNISGNTTNIKKVYFGAGIDNFVDFDFGVFPNLEEIHLSRTTTKLNTFNVKNLKIIRFYHQVLFEEDLETFVPDLNNSIKIIEDLFTFGKNYSYSGKKLSKDFAKKLILSARIDSDIKIPKKFGYKRNDNSLNSYWISPDLNEVYDISDRTGYIENNESLETGFGGTIYGFPVSKVKISYNSLNSLSIVHNGKTDTRNLPIDGETIEFTSEIGDEYNLVINPKSGYSLNQIAVNGADYNLSGKNLKIFNTSSDIVISIACKKLVNNLTSDDSQFRFIPLDSKGKECKAIEAVSYGVSEFIWNKTNLLINIPGEYKGLKVSKIFPKFFEGFLNNYDEIFTLTIPDNITEIENGFSSENSSKTEINISISPDLLNINRIKDTFKKINLNIRAGSISLPTDDFLNDNFNLTFEAPQTIVFPKSNKNCLGDKNVCKIPLDKMPVYLGTNFVLNTENQEFPKSIVYISNLYGLNDNNEKIDVSFNSMEDLNICLTENDLYINSSSVPEFLGYIYTGLTNSVNETETIKDGITWLISRSSGNKNEIKVNVNSISLPKSILLGPSKLNLKKSNDEIFDNLNYYVISIDSDELSSIDNLDGETVKSNIIGSNSHGLLSNDCFSVWSSIIGKPISNINLSESIKSYLFAIDDLIEMDEFIVPESVNRISANTSKDKFNLKLLTISQENLKLDDEISEESYLLNNELLINMPYDFIENYKNENSYFNSIEISHFIGNYQSSASEVLVSEIGSYNIKWYNSIEDIRTVLSDPTQDLSITVGNGNRIYCMYEIK